MTERLIVICEAKPPGTFTGRLESPGEVIVERTDRPLDPETPFAMRHAGKALDSSKPQPIGE
jgi:hypothetical protein